MASQLETNLITTDKKILNMFPSIAISPEKFSIA